MKKETIYWIAGLVVFAIVASILSRVVGAAVDGPPLLFAMLFALLALVGVLAFAFVKKFPKRWLWTAMTFVTGFVVTVYVGIWTNGKDYYNGFLANSGCLYDKSGSVVIEGYDKYYFVEDADKALILATHKPKRDSWGNTVNAAWYDVNGEKQGDDFEISVDRDGIEGELRDDDMKFHKF